MAEDPKAPEGSPAPTNATGAGSAGRIEQAVFAGNGRDFAPPLSGEPRPPEEPAGFPLIPGYKWVGKKKRKR